MLVNRKLLGWITIPAYRKKPGIDIGMEIMLVNRKLLGWITIPVYRKNWE